MKGTLKSRRAFTHIYDHGERAIGAHVVVFALTRNDTRIPELEGAMSAVGIVASRKVGHAPDRSRAKRVMRAALRSIRTRSELQGHLVLVARRALIADAVGSVDLEPELERLLDRAGALRREKP